VPASHVEPPQSRKCRQCPGGYLLILLLMPFRTGPAHIMLLRSIAIEEIVRERPPDTASLVAAFPMLPDFFTASGMWRSGRAADYVNRTSCHVTIRDRDGQGNRNEGC